MARAQFEYDEVGNTFYYVLLSFYAIILIPGTWFFFPRNGDDEQVVDIRECQCHGCVVKRKRKAATQPWRKAKKILTFVVLIVAWIIFALLVNKVSQIEVTHEEYDPYSILGLDQGADLSIVKKQYRELSKKFHPDRGGDAVTFDRIAKAYQALTDDESRENWEKYGNPDGPTATTFGIALPKWLVSKEYGLWVLAFYALLFMLILPVVVGIWWYNSIKYNVDKVLLNTTQLFVHFIRKTPRMEINRALMILSSAFEFNKEYNNEIILRPTDDVQLTRLMKSLQNLGENRKERPMCLPYALKARILISAYLSRFPLDSEGLEIDQRYTISRCYRLIEEMINLSQSLNYYTSTKIPLETVNNFFKMMPMIVQGLWQKNSSFLQLPHIEEHNLHYIRRNKVMNCGQLAQMDNERRRQVLNSLTDTQYRDVLHVLSMMPRLSVETWFEVQGEDDKHEVTAGCFVTLKIKLTRQNLLDATNIPEREELNLLDGSEEEGSGDEEEKEEDDEKEQPARKKVWEKQPKKKAGGGKKKGGKAPAKKPAARPAAAPAAVPSDPSAPPTPAESKKEKEKEKEVDEDNDNESQGDSDEDEKAHGSSDELGEESDDEEWMNDEKPPALEAVSHETHLVHCPFYPGDKYEWWWMSLSLVEKKGVKRLIAPIISCKTLIDTTTVDMKFPAPDHKGVFYLNLSIHSDSYLDMDTSVDIRMDVKEAKEVVLPKYEDTEDEKSNADQDSSAEEYTEESDSD